MFRHDGMQPGKPLDAVLDAGFGQHLATLVQHADVVVGLRPVDPYDPNSQRNASTRKWEHKDCRTKPRRTPIPI